MDHTRKEIIFPDPKWNINFFENSVSTSNIHEWNKLELNVHNSKSISIFKKTLAKYKDRSSNNVSACKY